MLIQNNSYRNKNNKNDIVTCSGSQYRIDYVKVFDNNGVADLKESGKTDLQALYDSHLPECDMSTILETLRINGSPQVVYEEGVEDVTALQNATPQERFEAMKSYDDNIKKYEAQMKALEDEIKALKDKSTGDNPTGEGDNNE